MFVPAVAIILSAVAAVLDFCRHIRPRSSSFLLGYYLCKGIVLSLHQVASLTPE